MADKIRVESTHNFIDTLRQAESRKMTVSEQVIMSESMIEDPRASKIYEALLGDSGLDLLTLEARRQALFARQMQKLIGDEANGLINDNAPLGAFATNTLERLDMNVRMQALRTYATRDIPMVYGGGAIESVKGFRETYQLPKGGFIGGDTNQVRIVGVDFHAQYVPVKPLTYGLRLGFVDSLKNDTLGFDAITKMGEAIQRAWMLDVDRIGYVGTRGEDGTTTDTAGAYRGILNLENVTITDLETTTDYTLTTKKLELMDINTVIEVLIGELNDMAQDLDWKAELVPNKILFYKELFAWLNKTAENATGTQTPFRTNKSILQEALDGWADSQNFDRISMQMLPYLSNDISGTKDPSMVASGTNSTGRIVIYRQDPYVGYMPLPMDLTGGATVFDINTNAFRRNYIAFVGYYLSFYTETFRYIDNGTTEAEVSDEMQDLIDGTSMTLSVSGNNVTHIATYPATIDASLASYKQDAIITFDTALPTGTVIDVVTYEGGALTPTSVALAGRKVVWLSELVTETIRNAITGHAGLTLTMVFTFDDNATAIDTNMNVKQVVSNDNFFTWTVIAEKDEPNIEIAA